MIDEPYPDGMEDRECGSCHGEGQHCGLCLEPASICDCISPDPEWCDDCEGHGVVSPDRVRQLQAEQREPEEP